MAWTKPRIKQALYLYEQNLSYAQIAKELGVTRNAVAGMIHREKFPKRERSKGTDSEPEGTIESEPRAMKPRRSVPGVRLPPQPPPVRIEIVPRETATIHTLKRRGRCRWIFGPIQGADTVYCNDKTVNGDAWCPAHRKIVYTKVPARKKQEPRPSRAPRR